MRLGRFGGNSEAGLFYSLLLGRVLKRVSVSRFNRDVY